MRSTKAWLIVIPALLFVTALLLRVVWVTDMHPDETLVYHFTRLDLSYTVTYQAEQDVHPPLWFSFFWVWRRLVGDSEFAGRIQALFFSLITLAMIYRIGRDWFGQARSGLFALLVLGMSAYFAAYALEIRPYALLMLLASISMWLFTHWLKRGMWRFAIAYGVVTGVMFYVHYFSAFLVIVQVFFFLLRRPSRSLIGQGIGAGLVALGVWLPWFPAFLFQIGHLRELAQEAGNSYGFGIGTPATTQATSLETVIRLVELATNGQPLLYGLVLLLGIILLRRSVHYGLALLWGLGVPAVSLALNVFAAVYTQRYVAYLTVGLALVLGAALAAIPKLQAVGTLPAALRIVPLRELTLALFLALNLWFLPNRLPVRVPYRQIYQEVSAFVQPGDVVLNLPANRYDQFIQWEQHQYLPALRANITTDPARVQEARRIWLMTGDWFDPAVRAQFDQLEPTHPMQRVIGQCDRAWCYLAQLMEAPPLAAPQRFGTEMDFWGIDIDSVTADNVQARLWWRAEQAPSLNYSISLRLVDQTGVVVAQQDGAIKHYGEAFMETSQLEPGRIYIDWRTLMLPTDLPTGVYNLELVVYQSWDNVRLLLPDGSDALLLDGLTFS